MRPRAAGPPVDRPVIDRHQGEGGGSARHSGARQRQDRDERCEDRGQERQQPAAPLSTRGSAGTVKSRNAIGRRVPRAYSPLAVLERRPGRVAGGIGWGRAPDRP